MCLQPPLQKKLGRDRKWVRKKQHHSGTTPTFHEMATERSILHHHRVPRRSSPQPEEQSFIHSKAQARVSRLQAALDLLGADNPDAELLNASLETAKRQCRVQPVGERLDSCLKFVERPRTHRATEEHCRGSSAAFDQVRISVGCRVARYGTVASRSPCMSGTSSVTHRAFDRNHIVAGFARRCGAVEEGAERVVGEAQFPVHGRCWGFSVFPGGKFDRRSRRQAPLSRARAMRQSVVVPKQAFQIWIAGSQSWGGQPSRSCRVSIFCPHRDGLRCRG